jgi:hypothetical protein
LTGLGIAFLNLSLFSRKKTGLKTH